METKNRQKMLLILAATVLGLYLGDLFVFSPLIASWKERAQRIIDMRAKVSKGEYMVKRQDAILRTLGPDAHECASAERFSSRRRRCSNLSNVGNAPAASPANPSSRNGRGEAEDEYMTLELHADYAGDVDRLTRFSLRS